MLSKVITCVLLAAIALQGVYGGLRESVVIQLGGSHDHAHETVVHAVKHACGHHDHEHHHHHHHHDHHHGANAPEPCHDHAEDCCEGTEIELDLVLLLSNPREKTNQDTLITTPVAFEQSSEHSTSCFTRPQETPSYRGLDPGLRHRLAVVRSTRLLL
tara:strand:- start:100 stop:573 length:474 start_codon:yes stop_codon:yes gene_type:complete